MEDIVDLHRSREFKSISVGPNFLSNLVWSKLSMAEFSTRTIRLDILMREPDFIPFIPLRSVAMVAIIKLLCLLVGEFERRMYFFKASSQEFSMIVSGRYLLDLFVANCHFWMISIARKEGRSTRRCLFMIVIRKFC